MDLTNYFSVYIGVLQNILLGLADRSQAVRLIVDTLTNVLEVSPEYICCSLSDLSSGDNGAVVLPAFAQVSPVVDPACSLNDCLSSFPS